jgi:hypothetical protein
MWTISGYPVIQPPIAEKCPPVKICGRAAGHLREALLVSQRDHRVDARGAAGGDVTG